MAKSIINEILVSMDSFLKTAQKEPDIVVEENMADLLEPEEEIHEDLAERLEPQEETGPLADVLEPEEVMESTDWLEDPGAEERVDVSMPDKKTKEQEFKDVLKNFERKMRAKEELETPVETFWAEQFPVDEAKKANQWLTEWLQKNAGEDKDLTGIANKFYKKLLKNAGPEEEHHPMEDIERSVLDTEYAGRPESDFNIKELIRKLKEEQRDVSEGLEDHSEEMGGRLDEESDEGFEDE